MSRPLRVRVSGPLERYARGFREELAGRGYSSWSVVVQLQLMAQLSNWPADRAIDEVGVTDEVVAEFVRDRAARGYARRVSPRGLASLRVYLRELGAVPLAPPPRASSAADVLVEEFVVYLLGERGLAASTVRGYRRVASSFLAARSARPGIEGLGLADLSAVDVQAFLLSESERLSARSLNDVVTGLRALLRFLHLRGQIASELAEVVPTGPSWHRRGARRVLDLGEVARLMAACDRRTAMGRRDHAILVVPSRLGLRAAEVAALRLEDVDWRAGELVVVGKGRRSERLPLPVDVGQALAGYCRRGRPRRPGRTLFLGTRAPFGALSGAAVGEIVRRACRRAGLTPTGAHALRRTAATGMRRGGAGLVEIGGVLRHQRPATTALYVRVDAEDLRPLARPWPQAGGA